GAGEAPRPRHVRGVPEGAGRAGPPVRRAGGGRSPPVLHDHRRRLRPLCGETSSARPRRSRHPARSRATRRRRSSPRRTPRRGGRPPPRAARPCGRGRAATRRASWRTTPRTSAG
ncbi:unnamed protein product, partial [Prorocentrum cordatum]